MYSAQYTRQILMSCIWFIYRTLVSTLLYMCTSHSISLSLFPMHLLLASFSISLTCNVFCSVVAAQCIVYSALYTAILIILKDLMYNLTTLILTPNGIKHVNFLYGISKTLASFMVYSMSFTVVAIQMWPVETLQNLMFTIHVL